MKAKIENVADRIVAELFQNGLNQKAKRLILELEDNSNGGGWGKKPIRDIIIKHLESVPAETLVYMKLTEKQKQDFYKLFTKELLNYDGNAQLFADAILHHFESVPLDGLVMAKIAEAIDRTKWKLKGIIRTKTMNMEDGFDKQILLKIGEIQIDVCDAVMEEILSN